MKNNSDEISILLLTEDYPIKPFDCEDEERNKRVGLSLLGVPFYRKMGFKFLIEGDKNDTTRLMFLDLTSFI